MSGHNEDMRCNKRFIRGHLAPIRNHYSDHITALDQSEASIHLEDGGAELEAGDEVPEAGDVLGVGVWVQAVPAGVVRVQGAGEGGVEAGEAGGEDGGEVAVLRDVGLDDVVLGRQRDAEQQGVPGQLTLGRGLVEEGGEEREQEEAGGGGGGGV